MKNNKITKELAPYVGGGIQLIIPILLGVYFGRKLDEGHSTPIWTIILSLLGIAIGMYQFLKSVLRINKNDKRNE